MKSSIATAAAPINRRRRTAAVLADLAAAFAMLHHECEAGFVKTLDSTAEPAVHAAGPMKRARQMPVKVWKKLLVAAPLPIGAYFLARAFTVPSGYPGIDMAFTLMRGLFFLCATGAFYLSLRALLAIKRSRQQT